MTLCAIIGFRIELLRKERGYDSKITTAPQRQGPEIRGFKQGTYGRHRADEK